MKKRKWEMRNCIFSDEARHVQLARKLTSETIVTTRKMEGDEVIDLTMSSDVEDEVASPADDKSDVVDSEW